WRRAQVRLRLYRRSGTGLGAGRWSAGHRAVAATALVLVRQAARLPAYRGWLVSRRLPPRSRGMACSAGRCPGRCGAASANLRIAQPAQALVELVLVSSILVVVLFGVFETVWWAYAQNVVTAAVQDGAYRASAQN